MTKTPSQIVILLLLLSVISAAQSRENSTTTGFESDFVTVQHQLRGIFHVDAADSFSVVRFDMLRGSDDVTFWGSPGEGLENMTRGFPISDLPLNRTFKNESFVVRLTNRTWDDFRVVSVWDPATSSDFGHVILTPSPAKSPTMFENCRSLSPRYRIRWTVLNGSVDIGLESAIGSQFYMAFGWASPSSPSLSMVNSDLVVAGFTEEGDPFAEDFFITENKECFQDKDGIFRGVCPDEIYVKEEEEESGMVNNTRLIYGHRKDGVSFVRFNRLFKTGDERFDVAVNETESMAVVWALGEIRPPDALHPHYLPQIHDQGLNEWYGFMNLSLSEKGDDCLGPLDAEEKDDQELIIAERNTPLVVTSGPPNKYPNPPSPSKVLYINKKEAPRLRVERGVPVKFSVQAGHDVALYVTSDPVGGNATSRNVSEVVYAGGGDYEGVPASPKELVWLPDRKTPDRVYYQSLFGKKMGWKIQVVDGGLSDMYSNSVLLDDQQVTLFWTLSEDSISFAARGEKKSGYLAIAFGTGMVNSFAYVGWVDAVGTAHVGSYWIDGRDASNLHPTSENLTDVSCKVENGLVTFEFTRPFSLSCSGRIECKNVIDPAAPLRVVWAMGAQWSEGELSERNMHSLTSARSMRVMLMHGSAEAEQDLRPVLAVHGFMMFVAWGILIPGGILSARYLKHLKGDGWFKIHVYLQYSGVSIMLLGLLFAAAELRGFHLSSLHVKLGITALVLACAQPINAFMRPKKPANGEAPSSKRIIWEYSHVIIGRCAVGIGIASLITGMKHLGDRYGDENAQGLNWALILWFLVGALVVGYLEYSERRRRLLDRGSSSTGTWVLGNEDDDSTDLLTNRRIFSDGLDSNASRGMEIQLEPVSRKT